MFFYFFLFSIFHVFIFFFYIIYLIPHYHFFFLLIFTFIPLGPPFLIWWSTHFLFIILSLGIECYRLIYESLTHFFFSIHFYSFLFFTILFIIFFHFFFPIFFIYYFFFLFNFFPCLISSLYLVHQLWCSDESWASERVDALSWYAYPIVQRMCCSMD